MRSGPLATSRWLKARPAIRESPGAYRATAATCALRLVYRGILYIVKYNGVLSAYDATSGEVKYQQRLAEGKSAFTSSPVASDGKVYLASEEGHVYVLKAGPSFEVIAENNMGESVLATPAISEGVLIYRTQSHVDRSRRSGQSVTA
jgi:outer membrane protein assembly factor BamB